MSAGCWIRTACALALGATAAGCGGSESEQPAGGATGSGGASSSAGTTASSGTASTGASTGTSGPGGASAGCDPLPAPSGNVIELGPGQIAELAAAIQDAAVGDTIVLQ